MPPDLAERIEHAYTTGTADEALIDALIDALESGQARAAEPDLSSPTGWRVNAWVKQGILLGFRLGTLTPMAWGGVEFLDRHLYPPRAFTLADGVRLVPGGTSIRRTQRLQRHHTRTAQVARAVHMKQQPLRQLLNQLISRRQHIPCHGYR